MFLSEKSKYELKITCKLLNTVDKITSIIRIPKIIIGNLQCSNILREILFQPI